MARWGQKRRKPPGFPRLPDAGKAARVTRFRGATAFPEGPKIYNVYGKHDIMVAWGEPPPGFVTGTTSKTEWAAVWAMDKVMKSIFGYSKDVRTPPFDGFPPYWSYQVPLMGGRTIRGGAVIDITVNLNGRFILVRVVTDYYHIMTTSEKLARDQAQLFALSKPLRGQVVVDVLERHIIGDKTGNGAIKAMWKAVQSQSSTNPAMIGTARRTVPV